MANKQLAIKIDDNAILFISVISVQFNLPGMPKPETTYNFSMKVFIKDKDPGHKEAEDVWKKTGKVSI
uniref:Uncharacterized protein n=1 Tax=viral metagenome TaxID=1070528 RepID=A0A6H1ZL37_9ZZZZ